MPRAPSCTRSRAATSSSRRTPHAVRPSCGRPSADEEVLMAKNDQVVERLLAYEEIGQLAARYAVATDARDLDALVALFVDDVQVGKRPGRPRRAQGVLRAVAARRRCDDPQRRYARHRVRRRRPRARGRVLPGRDPGGGAVGRAGDPVPRRLRAPRRTLVLRAPPAPALVRPRRRHQPDRPPARELARATTPAGASSPTPGPPGRRSGDPRPPRTDRPRQITAPLRRRWAMAPGSLPSSASTSSVCWPSSGGMPRRGRRGAGEVAR